MSRFVLATADQEFEDRVKQALALTNGAVRRLDGDALDLDPEQAVVSIAGPQGGDTGVVVLGPGLPVAAALEIAALFDQERPEVSMVLVASPTPKLWEQAMRAGIRDLVPADAPEHLLKEVLERAEQTAAVRRRKLQPVHSGADDTATGGHLITVVSPKGGSGKTTLATNLAVGLAPLEPGEVVLVDLDVQFGDVAAALRLVPDYTTAEAAGPGARGDSMTLKSMLTGYGEGLFTLCAPDFPEEGEVITPEQCAGILQLLAAEFRYVVVDTAAGITEQTLAALEVATDVIFVCTMDVSSVRNLRKELHALQELGMNSHRRHFVLNRADSRVGLTADDIERTVAQSIDVEVPSSRSVPVAMNQGVPVIQSDARSPVARQLGELVDRFTEESTGSRSGWFARKRSA
jgi:pilus assembly protein CpaE